VTIPASDIVVGLLMIAFGAVGLFLASRALDSEMYVFGLSLAGYAALFVIGQVKRLHGAARVARSAAP
jgi:hypothetical protein